MPKAIIAQFWKKLSAAKKDVKSRPLKGFVIIKSGEGYFVVNKRQL